MQGEEGETQGLHAWPEAHDYTAPFRFTGGTIDKVIVDVSGERYIDHEAEVRGWFIKD